MKWTRLEWVEMALIAAAVFGTWMFSAPVSWSLPFGKLVGYAAAALLAQSLVRDVVRLIATRRVERGAARRIGCLCAESTLGVLLVFVAITLTLLGITQPVTLGQTALTTTVGVLFTGGFLAKDFVIIVRREKDHGSIIVW